MLAEKTNIGHTKVGALFTPLELDTHGYNWIQIVDSNLFLAFSRILFWIIILSFFCYFFVYFPLLFPFFLSAILATAEHILNTAWKNWYVLHNTKQNDISIGGVVWTQTFNSIGLKYNGACMIHTSAPRQQTRAKHALFTAPCRLLNNLSWTELWKLEQTKRLNWTFGWLLYCLRYLP